MNRVVTATPLAIVSQYKIYPAVIVDIQSFNASYPSKAIIEFCLRQIYIFIEIPWPLFIKILLDWLIWNLLAVFADPGQCPNGHLY